MDPHALRRLYVRRLAIIALALMGAGAMLAARADASTPPTTPPSTPTTSASKPEITPAADLAPVNIVQVSGLIDEILIDEIESSIREAERSGAQALILQVNSRGAVVSRDRMASLLEAMN